MTVQNRVPGRDLTAAEFESGEWVEDSNSGRFSKVRVNAEQTVWICNECGAHDVSPHEDGCHECGAEPE